ncbi:imidazole glycerol phosphate synthase subunit HisF [Legionella cardiaca]|uniref:imidazole glycerol-phosphate synthase n=1 Tax=Legionella cardiaca TaxID=1071983 RepID=A0ABY8AN90_9GAMM|nr:imidazole glycerol phosphate synthase cyclase subunit [Legionella cardiaca]WED41924.1 imidazole glycerol phosphate synthase cyclase subunit [Legionella cardiaca]
MSNVRLIARLDIKGPNLIKGVHLEGLRVVGNPNEFATAYYAAGADELIYMDTVASLYGRNNLSEIVKKTAENVFIPITVGGGIRNVDDVKQLLRCGADKVAVNTAATKNPQLITEISRRFGSQCMVLSIEAKRLPNGRWEVMTDNGREHTGMDVIDWARNGQEFGAGEILLTSIDQEGTRKGFDIELIREVSDAVTIPIIASGGMGKAEDLLPAVLSGHADAIAMADLLHYKRSTLMEVRKIALDNNIHVRRL